MLAILFYCLKVLLCSGLLFGYYLLALRNKQFHEWNRYYLLMVVLLSFALPFVHIPVFFNGNDNGATIILRSLSFGNYGDEVIIRPNNNWQINWNNISIILYASISAFFLIKLVKTFNWINKIKSVYPSEMLEEISFYNTNENGTPFSFFKNIFWHKDIEPSSSKGLQMLRHEITHVRQLHSADKLLLEITTIIAWWNPFFHLIKKELSTIHEFIADQHAANGDDHLQYASLLLQKAFGSNNIPLSNPFFHSQLKRRIAMLTTIKNPRFSYLRRLMVLPLAACMFILLAFKFKEKKDINLLKAPVPITIVIDAGHGGIDAGTLSKDGIKEKDITLAIAQKISALATAKGIKVILTRNGDALPGNSNNVTDGLKQRIAISTNSGADLFISLHVNSSSATLKESGIGVFVSKTSNNLSLKSQLVASTLLDELEKSGLPISKEIQQRREHGVFVLDKNPLPSVLLELGYISNPTDAAFISDPKNQEKLANEILDGIIKAAGNLKNKNIQSVNIEKPENAKVLQAYLQDTIKKLTPKKDEVSNKSQKNNINNKPVIGEEAPKKTDSLVVFGLDSNKNHPIYVIINSGSYGEDNYITFYGTKFISYGEINPNDIQSINVLKGEYATAKYGEKGKYGVVEITLKKQLDDKKIISYADTIKFYHDYDKTFTKVEEPATFPGGLDGWRNYLIKNLQYPEAAQKQNIQGIVRVQLVVDKQGRVSEVKALNNLGGGLSEEAERVIKTGPNWVPAKQNGKLVTYRFVQTLTYQLK